jgi:hypothetical protein
MLTRRRTKRALRVSYRTKLDDRGFPLHFNPEMEARLVAEARSQGVPLQQLAELLLKEALTVRSLPHGVLTVDEFHHMLEGMAEGSEKLPNLPTESFSRESFYEDRLDGRDAVPPR